jgi:hypothetical protein
MPAAEHNRPARLSQPADAVGGLFTAHCPPPAAHFFSSFTISVSVFLASPKTIIVFGS